MAGLRAPSLPLVTRLLRSLAFSLLCALGCSASASRTLVLAVDDTNAPFSALSSEGPEGFCVDLAQALGKELGWEIRLRLMPYAKALLALEMGEVDAVCGLPPTPGTAPVSNTRSFLTIRHMIFVADDTVGITGVRDLAGARVAVLAGDPAEAFLARDEKISLLLVPETVNGLLAVANQTAMAFVCNEYAGRYFALKEQLTHMKTAGGPVLTEQYCILVRETNTLLLAQVEGGLRQLTRTNQMRALKRKWFGDPIVPHWLTVPAVVGVFLLILIVAGIVVALEFVWGKSLEHEVRKRTDQLEREVFFRQNVEEELRATNTKLHSIIDNSWDVILQLDLQGTCTFANNAAERLAGYTVDELLGQNFLELLAPEYRHPYLSQFARRLQGLPVEQLSTAEVLHKDGHRVWIELTLTEIHKEGELIGFQGISRDITARKQAEEERRRLEAQIQHAQKLESLGVLAGGIAHDFNNLLVGMLGNADLALLEFTTDSPIRRRVEAIKKASLRASELTNQMLAYSGKGRFLVQPIGLNALVEEMAHLLHVSISKNVDLRFAFADPLPSFDGDAAQVRQVVMNLITNASEAIGEQAGVITLRTGVLTLARTDISSLGLDPKLTPGDYVFLEVTDTGCGMDAETRTKIFEPFFTTKFTGRGLGLAAVQGIIRGHHGTIHIESTPDFGTIFRVYLPCTEPIPQHSASPNLVPTSIGSPTGETILVIDDEETVRAVTQSMLEKQGFHVLTASDGREGVSIFRANSLEIAAVLLDMTMPVMNGEEAFRLIRQTLPDARIILMSGYSEQDATARFAGCDLSGFLQKPFQVTTLVEKLGEILDG
jgi:PAS domain S-box-containing protein